MPVAAKNTFVTVDVTAGVKASLDGSLTNNGLALVANVTGLAAKFDSKESNAKSHAAQLDVTITDIHESLGGSDNTFIGDGVGAANTTGSDNNVMGSGALVSATASQNTAVGWSALDLDTTGASNTAVGRSALFSNTTGSNNTAMGESALSSGATDAALVMPQGPTLPVPVAGSGNRERT